jgi:hypothetical protein
MNFALLAAKIFLQIGDGVLLQTVAMHLSF